MIVVMSRDRDRARASSHRSIVQTVIFLEFSLFDTIGKVFYKVR